MTAKRHPSRIELEAWFDGEASEGLGWHLAECASCFEHVETLAQIRAAVRKATADNLLPSPLPAPDKGDGAAKRRVRITKKQLAGVPVLVLLLVGVLFGIGRAPLQGALSANAGHRGLSSGLAGESLRPVGTSWVGPSAAANSGTTSHATGSSWSAGGVGSRLPASLAAPQSMLGAVAGAGGPLTLAVIVPTTGMAATEGRQVTMAAHQAVQDANASGGVNGEPVQLEVVPAEDPAAVSALSGQASAAVGGFDAAPPSDVPWVLPADPWAIGPDVVATELPPVEAGARLGQDLLRRGAMGPVGVVVGTGPDTALASGLAQEVPTDVVDAPASGACFTALATLESEGVDAVAVAGSPQLAMSCAGALAATAWSPPDGLLLAPSAAYAGVSSAGVFPGTAVLTVLGLPWPQSQSPGAARFRAEVPGVTSYRALVTFAAVEMAVQVARAAHVLSMAAVADGMWQNDLYDFAGTNNVGAQVVQASPEGWATAP